MTTNNADRRPVKTVETSMALLEYLKEQDGATTNELAKEFGHAKSTVHRHLTTLNSLEFVVKDKDVYYPSLRFLDFGEYTRNRKVGYNMAKSKVEELADETNERAQFLVEEHGKGVYVHRATGSHAVQTDPGIGKWIYLNTIAAGKAILAHYSTEKVEDIIDRHGLPAATIQTITNKDELFEELTKIRERGYSFNTEENVKGLHAVGVPVTGPDEEIIGALSVSGPTHRMKGDWFEQELPDLLLGTSNELELNLVHS